MSDIQFVPFTDEKQTKQEEYFKAYVEPVGTVGHRGMVAPKPFATFAERYRSFMVKPDDVYIMSFPKCGTTWMQEIVWTFRNNTIFDHPNSLLDGNFRVPFIDFDAIVMSTNLPPYTSDSEFMNNICKFIPHAKDVKLQDMFSTLAELVPEPRTIKIHLPFSLAPTNLNEKAKVVYVLRNAKDVCISYYHHHVLLKWHDFKGTFEEFAEFFMNDEVLYAPFWNHIREAWEKRNHKNVCIIFYEHLKNDPVTEFTRLNEFLQTNLSDDQIKKIIEYTSFQNMKERAEKVDIDNSDVYINIDALKSGGFFRKGKSNNWKNDVGNEILTRFEDWEAENLATFDETFQSYYRRYIK